MFSLRKLRGWLVAAGAAVLAVLVAFGLAMRRARQDGINQVEREQQEGRDALQSHYDEIDRRPVDVGSAYDGLRRLPDDEGGR